MRIMTYNIRLGIQQGLEAIAEVLRTQRPDLVALQEVGCWWKMGPREDTSRWLADRAGLEHVAFVPCLEEEPEEPGIEERCQYGHALLSRLPITQSDIEILPRGTDEPRATLQTRLLRPDGRELVVLSTHLSHLPQERALQTPVFERKLDALFEAQAPAVVLGDLNQSPEEEGGDWLARIRARWKDADAELGRGTWPSDEPRLRLDYLLASRGHWTDVRLVQEAGQASDHLPLIATLSDI